MESLRGKTASDPVPTPEPPEQLTTQPQGFPRLIQAFLLPSNQGDVVERSRSAFQVVQGETQLESAPELRLGPAQIPLPEEVHPSAVGADNLRSR